MNWIAIIIIIYGLIWAIACFKWIFTCYKKQNTLYLALLKTVYPLIIPALVYYFCILLK